MGICYQDKTLKEAMDEKDQLFRQTGCIYGLDKLQLLEDDPVKFMRFQLRLVAACVNARETAKLIAASPTSLIMGELLFLLTTPEGDCACASHGLVAHVESVPFILRSVAQLGFENNPKIRDGDIFSTNEPYYGAPHGSDCFTLVPVFYDGELIAWTVGLNHILEVGGIVPGNVSGLSPNAFTDGFLYPPIKTGENFEQYKWWELLWMRRTRVGPINILDDKMRVAGAVGLRNKILEIVEEFGMDYFRQALKEILERERRQLRQRIRSLSIPGLYRFAMVRPVRYKGLVGKLFPSSDRDWLLHVPAEFRISSDCRITIDAEGMSSEADFHCNCYPPAVRMMGSLGWWTMLGYTNTINTAMDYLSDYKLAPGSMANPQNPFAGTAMSFAVAGVYIMQVWWHCLSYAYFARGFLEECHTHHPVGGGYGLDGEFADGFRWAGGNIWPASCESSGARPYKDGEQAIWAPPIPQSDLGEWEQYEFAEPTQLNLGMRLVPNYLGHGKFRGGLGMGTCQLIDEPGRGLTMAVYSSASSETGPAAHGFCGGYPGLGSVTYFLHRTNMREIIGNGEPYPTNFVEVREWLKEGKMKAERVEFYPADTPNIEMSDGDLFLAAYNANCGWGDPLERFFSLVERDVHYGWITPDVAETVYGAVTDEEGKVKVKESEELRRKMRLKRKERSVDAGEWWRRERQRVMNKEFSEDVYNMYADILKYEKFRHQFMGMWQLSEGYQL